MHLFLRESRVALLWLRGQSRMSFQKNDYKTCSELSIVSRSSLTRVFLKSNPDSPGAPCWQPYLWSKHLTPYGLATVLIPNKILKFNPGYHSLTRVYCAQQMTVSSPESQSKNYDKNCQSALKQADALDTSHGEYTTVTDSQIDRGEVTADSSLPPSDIKHRDKVSSILWTWSEHGSVTCLWSACVSMWGL